MTTRVYAFMGSGERGKVRLKGHYGGYRMVMSERR